MLQSDDLPPEEVDQLYRSYFADYEGNREEAEVYAENNIQILSGAKTIVPYLQTALLEEHLIEVDIAQLTRAFFTVVADNNEIIQTLLEQEKQTLINPPQDLGEYLKATNFLLTSPLSPNMGNVSIRHYTSAVFKYYTGTIAVELGCTFRNVYNDSSNPCLVFDFPQIGRVIKGFRSFRAKVLSAVNAKVSLLNDQGQAIGPFYQIEDISVSGLGFLIPDNEPSFVVGDQLHLGVKVEGCGDLSLNGMVRRIVPLRRFNSFNYICGVQFDLETMAMATDVERLVAAIQRLHLRELAEKTAGLSGIRIIR